MIIAVVAYRLPTRIRPDECRARDAARPKINCFETVVAPESVRGAVYLYH